MVHCDTQGIREDFQVVQKALREEFFPAHFLGVAEHMPNQTIIIFTVKHAGLAIPNTHLTT